MLEPVSEPADNNSPQIEEPQATVYDPAVAGVHAANQLEQSGFDRRQADAVVVAVRELAGDLATKSELRVAIAELGNELKTEIAGIESGLSREIAGLDSKLSNEIAGLDSRLSSKIAGLEGGLNGEISSVEGRLNGEIVDIKKTMATKEDLAQMQIQQAKDAFRYTMWTVGIIVGALLAGMGVATAILIAVITRLLAAA
ncbi:MAG: hypothetical protein OXU96_01065 [Gammaproteobacteria bacterium]|nr:hypothetical protein [Gammaproteobacteria bacterium]